ncbi:MULTISPECIES: IS200/IS605 family accessory protein TnpB-related protein [unclassified Rhizobium]|uniref:IS200/IS605 family accessory protein TnpB-related protein n=1 Tax=Rhizobium sp. 16-488-2b TaxID=2819991 RepID=UPI001ADACCE3|nr:IS200/IS605 family accessory protein TnpB-related protein [Rhizobium sp. 16-488-2b]MBO9127955.1 IS200/IS605 family accessory protein TnpB-related protein [Rhizobium sp. 16-488-2b]
MDLREGDSPAYAVVLDEYAALMSRAERLLLAKLRAGREWTGDLKVSFYQHLGLSAIHLDMAYRQLQAKLKSVAELASDRAKDLASKIASKRTDIKRKEKALAKAITQRSKLPEELRILGERVTHFKRNLAAAKDSLHRRYLSALKHSLSELHAKTAASASIGLRIHALRAALHQHKRRLAILEHRKVEALRQAAQPALCFGSRKLFRAQFALKENGYSEAGDWRKDWASKRSAQMTLDGNSSKESGNQFARLRRRPDGRFNLELRLPKQLAQRATRSFVFAGSLVSCVDFANLSFNHGNSVIQRAIDAGRPVTVKFLRDEKSWKVYVSVDDRSELKAVDFSGGALGVDLNAGHVSVSVVDAAGNPVESFNIPCVTYGKTSDQARDTVRKVAAEVLAIAERFNVPVVSEKLDFSKKKTALKDSNDARYARMLSSFAYSSFDAALASACVRRGVGHRRVNPAYTSIIGRVKFARRYGLSVHEAASVTIARRAMGCSERLPRSNDGTVTVPTNGSVHVTLDLPVRNGSRHVWTEWNGLNKEYHKKALAAQGSSGRRPRPGRRPKTSTGRSGAPLHGLSAEVGCSRRLPLQSRDPGVGRVPGIVS